MANRQTGNGRHQPMPVDHAAMRGHNLALVLRYVREHAFCSRADIATGTGLTKPAVTKLVGELLKRRLVEESEAANRGRGRPPTALTLDGDHMTAIGTEIRIDRIGVLVCNLRGDELARARRALPARPTPAAVMRALRRLVEQTMQRAGRTTAAGIGIAMPAIMNADRGVALRSSWMGWQDVPIRQMAVEAFGDRYGPITIEGVASLATLAISRQPPYHSLHHLVHLEIGAGAGVGAVLDGELASGAHGSAGSVGHMKIVSDGPRCSCGQDGCLDTLVGFAGFVRAVEGNADPERMPAVFSDYVREVAERVAQGDSRAAAAVDEVGTWIGRAMAIMIDIIDPEAMTLGGYISALQPRILDAAHRELERHQRLSGVPGCSVTASPLGDDAPLMGAAAAATAEVFRDLKAGTRDNRDHFPARAK